MATILETFILDESQFSNDKVLILTNQLQQSESQCLLCFNSYQDKNLQQPGTLPVAFKMVAFEMAAMF